jgi:phosphatidylinositol 4-kinase
MYSLLNYIAATNKEIYESSSASQIMNHPLYSPTSPDDPTFHSVTAGLGGMSEDEKRTFTCSQVTRLTISMLLQRLRSAEPTVEAAIAYNLVDLALSAPESAFVDIIRVFSTINRSANPDDPRFSNNMVRFPRITTTS